MNTACLHHWLLFLNRHKPEQERLSASGTVTICTNPEEMRPEIVGSVIYVLYGCI